jgi:hypothetical protein
MTEPTIRSITADLQRERRQRAVEEAVRRVWNDEYSHTKNCMRHVAEYGHDVGAVVEDIRAEFARIMSAA